MIKHMAKKECSICGIEKELNEYYGQKKKNKDGEEYIYYPPYCKKCTSKKAYQWISENREQFEINRYKYRETQKYRDRVTAMNEKLKDYNKQWRQENAEYLRDYNRERVLHKEHDITDDELSVLYEYCNSSCMYCGMSEEEAKEKYNNVLHRDHAINDGSNGIDNCVLACKGCNVSKWNRDWDVWYTPDNPKYTYERYILIEEWLESFKVITK